jgi:hypothetical protein
MEEPTNPDPQTDTNHHSITRIKDDGHSLHHLNATIAHDTEQPDDPGLQGTHTTMTMTK